MRRSSVETSSPRPHCCSRRSRSAAKPSARRFMTWATSSSACSTVWRGSSTKPVWSSSQRRWNVAFSSVGSSAGESRRPRRSVGRGGRRRPRAARVAVGVSRSSSLATALAVLARSRGRAPRGRRRDRLALVRLAASLAARARPPCGPRRHAPANCRACASAAGVEPSRLDGVVLAAARRSGCPGESRVLSPGPPSPDLLESVGSLVPVRAVREQLVEQRAVVDHRLTQVLGARALAGARLRDRVRRAVVLDDLGWSTETSAACCSKSSTG